MEKIDDRCNGLIASINNNKREYLKQKLNNYKCDSNKREFNSLLFNSILILEFFQTLKTERNRNEIL